MTCGIYERVDPLRGFSTPRIRWEVECDCGWGTTRSTREKAEQAAEFHERYCDFRDGEGDSHAVAD